MSEAPKSSDNDSKFQTPPVARQQEQKGRGAPLRACRNCGMTWKWIHYCPAEEKPCKSCGKIGHFAKMCRSRPNNSNNNNTNSESGGPQNRRKWNSNRGNNENRNPGNRRNNERSNESSGRSSPLESNSNDRKNYNNSNRNNRTHNGYNGQNSSQQFQGRWQNRNDGRTSDNTDNSTNSTSDVRGNGYHYRRENSDNSQNSSQQFQGRWQNGNDGKKGETNSNKNSEDADNSPNSTTGSQGNERNSTTGSQRSRRRNNHNRQKNQRDSKTDTNGENYNNDDCRGANESNDNDKNDSCNFENFGDSRQDSKYAYTNVKDSRYNPGRDCNAKPSNFSNNDYSQSNGGESNSTPGYFYEEQKKHEAIGLKQRLAKSFYDRGNYEAALSHYSRLIEMCPKDPTNFNNRSACYMMMEQYDNAVTDANKVIQLDPSCVKAYSRVIKCSMLLGYTMSVEFNLTKLSQLDPKNQIISIERQKLKELQGHLKRKITAESNKNYKNALDCVNKCLIISPHCPTYKIKKAEYLALLKRHNEAQQILNEILKKDAINADAKYILGLRVYHEDIEEASRYFKDILRLDPDHAKCLQIYKKAKKIVEMKNAGNDAFRSGNFSGAHRIYLSAIAIDPDNTSIAVKLSYNLGQASSNLGNHERAIKEYSRAIEFDSNHTKALKQRGKCYMEIKDYEEAIADFARVCSLDPGNECQKLLAEAEKLLATVKKDVYEILGVSRDPSIEEVKKAYKDMAMLHHPDRHSNATTEQQKKHERKFKNITSAYRDLLERCKRKLLYPNNSRPSR